MLNVLSTYRKDFTYEENNFCIAAKARYDRDRMPAVLPFGHGFPE